MGSVGKGDGRLGILVNPSELCKYMNVCVCGWVGVYKEREQQSGCD